MMGRWLSWPWAQQRTQDIRIEPPTEDVPGEQEQERIPSPIPLDAIPVQLEDVLAQAIFKDQFQCFFEHTHTRLYLLLRDSIGHAQQMEGRIPVMILDESHLAQSILLLQKALRKMQEVQAQQSPSLIRDVLAEPWPSMSHTPTPLVTWLSTSQDPPSIWQSFEPSYAFFQEATSENSPHFFDEEENEEDYDEDYDDDFYDDFYDDELDDEDEDEETDDGHGYSSYS